VNVMVIVAYIASVARRRWGGAPDRASARLGRGSPRPPERIRLHGTYFRHDSCYYSIQMFVSAPHCLKKTILIGVLVAAAMLSAVAMADPLVTHPQWGKNHNRGSGSHLFFKDYLKFNDVRRRVLPALKSVDPGSVADMRIEPGFTKQRDPEVSAFIFGISNGDLTPFFSGLYSKMLKKHGIDSYFNHFHEVGVIFPDRYDGERTRHLMAKYTVFSPIRYEIARLDNAQGYFDFVEVLKLIERGLYTPHISEMLDDLKHSFEFINSNKPHAEYVTTVARHLFHSVHSTLVPKDPWAVSTFYVADTGVVVTLSPKRGPQSGV